MLECVQENSKQEMWDSNSDGGMRSKVWVPIVHALASWDLARADVLCT
jgi:hypothetical protein